MSSVDLPEVLVLTALSPVEQSCDLRYPKLNQNVAEHTPKEAMYWRLYSDSKSGSIEEYQSAHRLAEFFLLKTSQDLLAKPVGQHALLSERFTVASQELYETGLSRELWRTQFGNHVHDLHQQDNNYAAELIDLYETLGYDSATQTEQKYGTIFPNEMWRSELRNRHQDVIDLVEDKKYEATHIKDLFELALPLITGQDDALEWTVEMNSSSASVMVSPSEKKITVGEKRPASSMVATQKLVAHELLTHVYRAHNGAQTSDMLAKGLPGYVDAEEGLAIMSEVSIDEKMPLKLSNRVVSMGIALGYLGSNPSRKDMITMTYLRSKAKNPDADDSGALKKAHSYVNRMYRGGHGNVPRHDVQAIFTKDLVYFNGYKKMCDYINKELTSGRGPSELFDYVMLGKFDPTNDLHTRYVEEHKK